MVMEEIYILTKHANFPSRYVESIPVFKRRFYLQKLKEDLEAQKNSNEQASRKAKNRIR